MKLLTNVLMKLVRGGFTDRVLYIDNLPEELIYEYKHPVKCEGKGIEQHYVPDFDKPKQPTLYEELRLSQTGDKGIIFDLDNEQSKRRYLTLRRYMESVYSNKAIPQDPVVNSTDAQNSNAPALALSQVPRVVLPVLSPAEASTSVTGSTTDVLDVEKLKQEAIDAYKQEQKDRMAKARNARRAPVKNII